MMHRTACHNPVYPYKMKIKPWKTIGEHTKMEEWKDKWSCQSEGFIRVLSAVRRTLENNYYRSINQWKRHEAVCSNDEISTYDKQNFAKLLQYRQKEN